MAGSFLFNRASLLGGGKQQGPGLMNWDYQTPGPTAPQPQPGVNDQFLQYYFGGAPGAGGQRNPFLQAFAPALQQMFPGYADMQPWQQQALYGRSFGAEGARMPFLNRRYWGDGGPGNSMGGGGSTPQGPNQ